MPGIPSDLNRELIDTLLRCGPFDSDAELRAVFFDLRLHPWRDRVPEASSRRARVLGSIAQLADAENIEGENALVLLLLALQDGHEPGTACYRDLRALAEQLVDAGFGCMPASAGDLAPVLDTRGQRGGQQSHAGGITIIGDGNVIGNNSSSRVDKHPAPPGGAGREGGTPVVSEASAPALPPTADLQITLTEGAEDAYSVVLALARPEDQAERLPERGAASFDFDSLRSYPLLDSHACVAYGRSLTASLFADPALVAFRDRATALVQQAGQTLRVRLLIDRSVDALHALRWELLRNKDDTGFVSTDQNALFSRFVHTTDWLATKPRPRGKVRALVVVANPADLAVGAWRPEGRALAPVDVRGELGRAQQALAGVSVGVLVSDPDTSTRVTRQTLFERLGEGYDVLYLVGHGGFTRGDPRDPASPRTPYVLLENNDGTGVVVKSEELAAGIADLPADKRPGLVVLASCQSAWDGHSTDRGVLAALGPRLAEAGVPAVLAMQDDVSMQTVAEFMPVFFCALLETGQVDLAMARARAHVRERPDWWVPVLLTRLKDGQLFETTTSRTVSQGHAASGGPEAASGRPADATGTFGVDPGALRRGLQRLDSVEIDSLCLDYFPAVYDRLSPGMRRDQKVNLLLDYVRRNPEMAARLATLLRG